MTLALCAGRSADARVAAPHYPTMAGPRCSDVAYGQAPTRALEKVVPPATALPRRPNPDGAVAVAIGVYVDEIADVDANANSFSVLGYLDQIWCDPDQRYTAGEGTTPLRRLVGPQAEQQLALMWRPDIAFVNRLEPVRFEKIETLIHPDGTVELRQTFQAKLQSNFNLRAFPFDEQHLPLVMESFSWQADELIFLPRHDIVGFSDEFRMVEWQVLDVRERVSERMEARDQAVHSRVEAEVGVRRRPGVYVTKVMLPLAVITLMTMIVFWLEAQIFGSIGEMLSLRLGTSFTGLLTAVAYQFIVSGSVPKHVYNTFLDVFVGWSFVAIALSIAETVVIGYLSGQERTLHASRLDRTARWVFPTSYVAAIVVSYAIYMR